MPWKLPLGSRFTDAIYLKFLTSIKQLEKFANYAEIRANNDVFPNFPKKTNLSELREDGEW